MTIRVLPLPTQGVVPPGDFFEPVWWRLGEGTWLAGGSVVRWLSGDKHVGDGDFDLWGPKPEAISMGVGLFEVNTELSRTHVVPFGGHPDGQVKVQIINRPYSGLTEVLQSFDFTARMAGTDGKYLFVGDTTLSDIANKRLRRNKTGDFSINITSLYGLVRYANKGYKIDYSESAEMLKSWGVPPDLIRGGY